MAILLKPFAVFFAVAACVAVMSPYRVDAAVLMRPVNNLGLVGYWSFNEGNGAQAGDSSGNGNHGALVNSPSWISGKRGTAIEFDGSTNYVQVAHNANQLTTSGLTISAWIKPDSLGATDVGRIVDKSTATNVAGGYMLSLSTSNRVQLRVNNGTSIFSANNAFQFGQWVHVAATVQANGATVVYINGAQSGTGTTGALSGITTSNVLRIGARSNSDSDRNFDGVIDEVRVYNRALSASEMSALYHAGQVIVRPSVGTTRVNTSAATLSQNTVLANGLIGHWTFDGVDVDWGVFSAADRSGQANHGTLTGLTQASATIGKLGQALRFNGSNAYIQVPHNAILSGHQGMSFSWWAKKDNNDSSGMIIAKGDGSNRAYWIQMGSSGNIHYAITQSWVNYNSGVSYPVGEWVHFVLVVDGVAGSARLYKDGVLADTNSVSTRNFADSTIPLEIGRQAPSNAGGNQAASVFGGLLDDVRIYSRALSDSEVLQLYRLGR